MDEPVQPAGARWLRWLGWGLGIFILLLFVAHAIWTSVMANRMANAVKALQQAGEPMLPADFATERFDASDNAGFDILEAAKLVDIGAGVWRHHHGLKWLPLTDSERAIVEDFDVLGAAALKRLEQGVGKPRLDWDVNTVQPMAGFNQETTLVRYLADVVGMKALLDFDKGDHRSAIERIEQRLWIATFLSRRPTLLGPLHAMASDEAAAEWIARFAPDLRIGEGSGDVQPEDVRRVILRLMDDEHALAGMKLGLRGERMLNVHMIYSVMDGTAPPGTPALPGTELHPALRYFIRPLYYRSGSKIIDTFNRTLAAADEKSLPATQARLPVQRPSNMPVPIDAVEFSMMMNMEIYMQQHYRFLTSRRLGAVALAIRWYAVEHDGKLPATLEDLVPRYLPALPVDRLNASLKPLAYKPNLPEPFIYSVGMDGKDDGGSFLPLPGRPFFGRALTEWDTMDRIQPLYRVPRPAPPATQ